MGYTTNEKCDITTLKWCPSMKMVFDQQFACIRQFFNEKWVAMNVVSINDHGSIVMHPYKYEDLSEHVSKKTAKSIMDEQNKFAENYNPNEIVEGRNYFITASSKAIALHLLQHCSFCGASLRFPKEDVKVQQ